MTRTVKAPVTRRLGEVAGSMQARAVANALFNELRINAYQVAIVGRDTTFTYAILTDQRIRNADADAACAFVRGMVAGMRVFA